MNLSARAGRIAVSPTMKVAADAMKMKAQGVDVDRLRRRGAGLSDADPHRRRGAPRHRRQLHEVHQQLRHRRSQARHRRALQDRQRRRLSAVRSDLLGGRQAGAVQQRAGAVRAWRRGHHPHAGLADAGRADQARRGDAGHRAVAARERVPPDRPTRCLAAITPRTRGMIINSPDNPTGAVMPEAELESDREGGERGAGSGSCWISATTS